MLEMSIDSIRVSLLNYQRVVILRVKETNRYLPIWIGPPEADSIALKLQDVSVPRPMTHDLLRAVFTTLGATVNRIVVSELKNDTFYAKIVLQHNGAMVEVDSRPSDAIALAVRTDAPIFADASVLEKAGVEMDQETGKPVVPTPAEREKLPITEEEMKSLSAFSEFIQKLDSLDDFKEPPARGRSEAR